MHVKCNRSGLCTGLSGQICNNCISVFGFLKSFSSDKTCVIVVPSLKAPMLLRIDSLALKISKTTQKVAKSYAIVPILVSDERRTILVFSCQPIGDTMSTLGIMTIVFRNKFIHDPGVFVSDRRTIAKLCIIDTFCDSNTNGRVSQDFINQLNVPPSVNYFGGVGLSILLACTSERKS